MEALLSLQNADVNKRPMTIEVNAVDADLANGRARVKLSAFSILGDLNQYSKFLRTVKVHVGV